LACGNHLDFEVEAHGLFRVRDCWAVAVTCGGWSSLLGELGSCVPDSDRGCPLRSGRSWPGCGPRDGMAGEDDRAWYLAAVAPAHAMGEAGPG
jgi:hypothetical protein